MGRNAKSVAVHLAQGNPNRLTKAEIEHRKKSEVKIGADKIVCPETVKADLVAYKKWQALVKEYQDAKKKNGVDLFKSSDVGILERYCLSYSKWLDYSKKLKRCKTIATIYKWESVLLRLCDSMRKDEDRLLLNVLAKIKNIPKELPPPPVNPMEDEFEI